MPTLAATVRSVRYMHSVRCVTKKVFGWTFQKWQKSRAFIRVRFGYSFRYGKWVVYRLSVSSCVRFVIPIYLRSDSPDICRWGGPPPFSTRSPRCTRNSTATRMSHQGCYFDDISFASSGYFISLQTVVFVPQIDLGEDFGKSQIVTSYFPTYANCKMTYIYTPPIYMSYNRSELDPYPQTWSQTVRWSVPKRPFLPPSWPISPPLIQHQMIVSDTQTLTIAKFSSNYPMYHGLFNIPYLHPVLDQNGPNGFRPPNLPPSPEVPLGTIHTPPRI